MDTNLVRASRLDRDFQQGETRHQRLSDLHQRDRGHSVGIVPRHHFDPTLASTDAPHLGFQQILEQRLIQHLFVGGPLTGHHREVSFACFTLPELILQVGQGASFLGNQQDTAGVPVQPVDQLQKLGLGPCHAQLLNDAKTDTRAAMHGNARGLVDGNQPIIFQQDREIAGRYATRQLVDHGLGLLCHPFGNTNRWQTHHVSQFHAGVCGGAPLVESNLAATNDAVNVGLGHTLEVAHQKVIQTLPRCVFIDDQHFDLGWQWGWIDPYNVFH